MSKRKPTAADIAVRNAKRQARKINEWCEAIWAAQGLESVTTGKHR